MRARLLGWAGLELEDAGSTLVIDPLADAGAVWARAGDHARGVAPPPLVAAERAGSAVAGLLTHLHRDHADAAALAAALAPGAPVFAPEPFGGSAVEEAGVAEAGAELAAAGLAVRPLAAWATVAVDGWSVTAVPAVDGLGDPQLSWLVERGGSAVVHGGDTRMHGWWWRVAERAGGPIDVAFLPINAARVQFPHRRPASPQPATMGGLDAALAADQLRAGRLVPIHYGAYRFPPVYVPDEQALATLRAAAETHGVMVDVPPLGVWFEVGAAVSA